MFWYPKNHKTLLPQYFCFFHSLFTSISNKNIQHHYFVIIFNYKLEASVTPKETLAIVTCAIIISAILLTLFRMRERRWQKGN